MEANATPRLRLLSYDDQGTARAALALGDDVYELAAVTGDARHATMLAAMHDWPGIAARLRALPPATALGAARPLASLSLREPLRPGTIFCAGANYADHVAEMNRANNRPPDPDPHELGLRPWHFIKAAGTVVGPGAAVVRPPECAKFDWEIELAAVIGTPAKDVTIERALDHVAGYVVAHDVSARDLGWRPPLPPTSPFYADWVAHKSFDGSCPIGPWIVPAWEIADPQDLDLKLWVNDVLKQDSNTKLMIFTLAEQIAQLSHRVTLVPGDLILTGTPAGVGNGRGEFLQPGDRVRLWIECIGELAHTIA
jgi:2-keto-4-pentenoate hydratase/2-oxohepta-3-ene-1,7-dioic acid hydratase in catechol pathway